MAERFGRGNPKLKGELLEEAIRLYKSGYSTLEVSKKLGVSPQAVWVRLKALGIARSRKEAQKLRRMKEKMIKKHVSQLSSEVM